ncbi:MAG: hypothetical protein GX200_05115 [Firmicutes bacterium]|nr:hypothetical protein [Bacillota bacterium]
MNIFIKIFLLVLLYPVLPIMYFLLMNETKPRKNIVLGVTLPYPALDDPELKAACQQFKRALGKAVLLLAFPPFLVFFADSISVVMFILFYWLLLAIIIPFIPYTKYHRKLKALKQERNWEAGSSQKILVDLKALAANDVQAKVWPVIPALLVSAFPLAYELTAGLSQTHFSILAFCATLLLVTVLFFTLYRLVSRQRTEIIAEDSEYNLVLTRIRRVNWTRFWLSAAWINALYTVILWLSVTGRTVFFVFLLATALYTVAILWTVLKAEFATRNMQHKLAAASPAPLYTDEDRYWINGMFYYNPNDQKSLVSNRVGIGMTVNLARPAGKITMAFALLCLLSVPVLPLWVMAEEFTPLRIEATESAIVITHLSEIAKIMAQEIESVELLPELPAARRIVGTGMDNLRKGTFDVEGYGRGKLYLNPRQPPFLVIYTRQGFIMINGTGEVLAFLEDKIPGFSP